MTNAEKFYVITQHNDWNGYHYTVRECDTFAEARKRYNFSKSFNPDRLAIIKGEMIKGEIDYD